MTAGWFGKIPALGDFTSRRLPPEFVGPWDTWLQASVAASRTALGARWLDVYLSSPLWRFALMAGCCGEQAWLGVVMPSVDRVGRYFPFTIAAPICASTVALDTVASDTEWYRATEEAALAMLDSQASADDLEVLLGALPPLPQTGTAVPDDSSLGRFWHEAGPSPLSADIPTDTLGESLAASITSLCAHATRGKTLWWACSADTGALRLHGFDGLPAPGEYTRLLSHR